MSPNSTAPELDYIELRNGQTRELEAILIPWRAGRDDPEVDFHATDDAKGYILTVKGKDGIVEHVGSQTRPVSPEIIRSAKREQGILLVSTDIEGTVQQQTVLYIKG